MSSITKSIRRRVRVADWAARWVITLGGLAVIAAVVAIIVLIVGTTLPLFRPAEATSLVRTELPRAVPADEVLAVGADLVPGEQQRDMAVYLVGRDGVFTFLDLPPDGEATMIDRQPIVAPGEPRGQTVAAVETHHGRSYTLLWSDGGASLVEVVGTPEFDALGRRTMRYVAHPRAEMPGGEGPTPLAALLRQDVGSQATRVTRAALLPDGAISVVRQTTTKTLLGPGRTTVKEQTLGQPSPGRIAAITMDRQGRMLYAGTSEGAILLWELDDEGDVRRHEVVPAFRDKRAITAMAMVLGDVSLVVGDERGEMTVWFDVREPAAVKLRQIHRLQPQAAPVRQIIPAGRNKTLVSLDRAGRIYFDHTTSRRRLLTIEQAAGAPLERFGLSIRGNALAALDAERLLHVWQIDNPHPEISWGTLFGRVHYENYERPEWTWQTTGSEDAEPKMSLVPVLFGTIKGTFYAMLLAVPLGLFGAAYTSHFTTPAFKRTIKPAVELMAAVPSVVIGFLVALWLAPIIERWVLAVFASLATVPAAFILFMILWQAVRRFDWAKRVENGYEFMVLLPVVAAGVAAAILLVGPIESLLFGGDFKLWLRDAMNMQYDQRNNVIIAFGLGFAVIPIIFSLTEDSLSTVPHTLSAASMALGASRWQTLWRIVLPSGSPGIFAAVMIGFGRAVGETMIVLMATGNTPILDMSPFNGMRTLSANIAVEIPEAPVGGTLYRVLFLCAVLLFTLTFLLNTAAELVRQRLRKRFGRF